MLAVQPRLPYALASARRRSVRRPFHPGGEEGAYRLPNAVRDRLTVVLTPFRNRQAAFDLAVFLARFWSSPAKLAGPFPIDRRELADRLDLALSEARVRGAIRVLEEIGFLDRALPASGSLYKATEDGLHRKPILYVFGPDYTPAFLAANKRAAAARGVRPGDRRPITPSTSPRPSTAFPVDQLPKSPKSKSEADRSVIMGELKSGIPPMASEPNANLEAALARLKEAIGLADGGFGKDSVRRDS